MRNQVNQLEQIRQQLQIIGAQKAQLESQRREIDLAMDGLKELPEGTTVYKSAGSVLIRADDQEALKKELDDEKESITVRVTTLQKQEDKLKERFGELQSTLQKALEGQDS